MKVNMLNQIIKHFSLWGYVFFIIGISWIPIGIVFMITVNSVIGIAFMGMGISYMAIGLANKDKWKTT